MNQRDSWKLKIINVLGLKKFISKFIFNPPQKGYQLGFNPTGFTFYPLVNEEPLELSRDLQQNIKVYLMKQFNGEKLIANIPMLLIRSSGNSKRKLVIFSHGNASDLGDTFEFGFKISDCFNVDFLLYDYTGYGHSKGMKVSEESICSDLQNVLAFASLKYDKIFLWGFSLGSCPTVDVAFKAKVTGVILQAPFASVGRLIDDFDYSEYDMLDNYSKIDKIDCPIYICHGSDDEVIPLKHAELLAKKAKIQLVIIKGGRHNDLFSYITNSLQEVNHSIKEFLKHNNGHSVVDSHLKKLQSELQIQDRLKYKSYDSTLIRSHPPRPSEQLTPESSALKTSYKSGFLPHLPQKTKDSIFQSLDVEKSRKPKNFDFSNLQRTISTSKPRSRSRQRTQLQPLSTSQKIQSRLQLNKIIQGLIKAITGDVDLGQSCKQLCASSHKLLELLLMLSSQEFYTIHKKMKLQSIDCHNIMEIDRVLYCLQQLGIPVPLNHLILLSQLTQSLFMDQDFGMICQFNQLLQIIQQTLQHMRILQDESTSANSDDEDRMTTSSKIIQRMLMKQSQKKVQFKMKRLGYLNPSVVAFYDAYADLKKRVGREWNAKNYQFSCVRIGYIDLIKYPQYHDENSKREMKIFGNSRSKYPVYLQFIYKHKSASGQELGLTKIFFSQPNGSVVQADRDFHESMRYCLSLATCYPQQVIFQLNHKTVSEPEISFAQTIPMKQMVQDENEVFCPGALDEKQEWQAQRKQFDPRELPEATSSCSEDEDPVYDPVFVKSIVSYPHYLTQTQIQLHFPVFYRYYYSRMFTTTKLLKEENIEFNIKPAYQFKENFLVVPSCDDSHWQRHIHKQPDTLEQSDESDNEINEIPLEALEKEDLHVDFQYQPTIKDVPQETIYLKSQSSVIQQDEYKVSANINFANLPASHFVCLQESYPFLITERFPLSINYEIITEQVTKAIPLKEVNIDASTIIIDNTLTFDSVLRNIDTAPINLGYSSEEPSFDEEPMEIELPEEQQIQQIIHDSIDEELTIEKATQTMDYEIQSSMVVEVKDQYVSAIHFDNQSINFFLDNKFRLLEPQRYSVTMEGKEIKSMQTSVENRGNKILMKSFTMLASVDQRFEQTASKPIEEEEEEQFVIEEQQLPPDWNQGEFRILIQCSSGSNVQDSLLWLIDSLKSKFPGIKIDEFEGEGFEAYIQGVGPINKRDGSDRLLLFKKENEAWDVFIEHFQYRSLQLYDTLCCVISLYGSVSAMGQAQDRFYALNKSRSFKSHPYKYVDVRPTTGNKFNRRYG